MLDTTIYKEQLLIKKSQVEHDLKEIAVLNETTGDWVAVPEAGSIGTADENIEADTVEEWNERRATLALLETMYRNCQRALEKITADTYGSCEICAQEIQADRLVVNPAARTCKEHLEAESKLPL